MNLNKEGIRPYMGLELRVPSSAARRRDKTIAR